MKKLRPGEENNYLILLSMLAEPGLEARVSDSQVRTAPTAFPPVSMVYGSSGIRCWTGRNLLPSPSRTWLSTYDSLGSVGVTDQL